MNKDFTEYIPVPISTDSIILDEELEKLSEEMAKNVHENWAKARMEEGWSYGPQRDDAKKHHPCLVPYDDLPDSEKEYDRITSRETLKFILSQGFEIKKKL